VRVRFGHFDLDSDTRQLLRDGEDVHLSPKAFAVLSVLLAKRPNVVAKADLFGEIWPDVFVVDANLNVLVGEIRRALDDDAQSPRFIRTVHGIGYAFCGQVTEPGPAAGSGRSVRLQPDRVIEGGGAVRFWLAWKNQTFSLEEGDNIIGRDPRCEVWVDHSGVSRRHASIRIEGAQSRPVLTDLESTNGTFVAGKRITEATPLADGDAIKVGSVTLKFREWTEQASRTRRIRGRTRAIDERP
jgi:DNA-binding winged helix-turn-helix (wHTH) protein